MMMIDPQKLSLMSRLPPRTTLRHKPALRLASCWHTHIQKTSIKRPWNSSSSSRTTASASLIDHLVLNVDGFNANKAQAVFPALKQLQLDGHNETNMEIIAKLLPARLHAQLYSSHPQLLVVDMQSWVDFLISFGFEEGQIADLLRGCPEVFHSSNIFQAGQLLLFLRQHLQVPQQELVNNCFKWAAALGPAATQARMAAVAECLTQHLQLQQPQQLLTLLQVFPEVLGWDVEQELMPKLQFFESLGPAAKRLLSGTLYEQDTGYFQGLRSWHYSVLPKLQLLQNLLGSEEEAKQLIMRCPGILKLPVETKLQPVLTALSGAGLDGQQVAQLLRDCPALLAQPKECVVSRINFLVDAIGSTVEDLLLFAGYLQLPLADVIGPRYYFLARAGHVNEFSNPESGTLQLRRVLQPALQEFLHDVAQVSGQDVVSIEAEYQDLKVEWDNLLGWCCDKAFSSIDGQVSSLYQEQVNMFYVLVQ